MNDTYLALLADVKSRVHGAQFRAALAANRELLLLYWDIGRLIVVRRHEQGWGAGVIPRLAKDLETELGPGIKGFSERNLKRMVQYHQAYPRLCDEAGVSSPIGPQAVAQLAGDAAAALAAVFLDDDRTSALLTLQLPWGHNILLLEKVADLPTRAWYMRQCVDNGWSRDVLATMLKTNAHARQGAAVTNFAKTLSPSQSTLAQQTLKDPYVFDFLTLTDGFRERELELGLLNNVEKFLIELGVGFAFVGRDKRITLGDNDYILDLLFYHLRLRCFVVVELKVGAFTPEHAGKMNFYLNLVDDTLRHADDQPSIGLILCQEKDGLVAEYALRGLDKPIGVSQYELTRALPPSLSSSLPTIEEIEAELSATTAAGTKSRDQT